MSPGNSSSHNSSSRHSCQSNPLLAAASFPKVDILSSVFESAHAPDFQQQRQGFCPKADCSWLSHSPVRSLRNDTQSTQYLPTSLRLDTLYLSFNWSASLPGTTLDSDTPLQSLENDQSLKIVNRDDEHLTDHNPLSVLNA